MWRAFNARRFRNPRLADAASTVAGKRYTQHPANLRQGQDFFGLRMSGIAHSECESRRRGTQPSSFSPTRREPQRRNTGATAHSAKIRTKQILPIVLTLRASRGRIAAIKTSTRATARSDDTARNPRYFEISSSAISRVFGPSVPIASITITMALEMKANTPFTPNSLRHPAITNAENIAERRLHE
ncbi:hypothetical protein LMG22037_03873 [Paraburkholderia phenoliruptrix]|uniref:Uncharacterized protein n=1 Tax=Paraburkholderia phenoliruptrix TaxID=252970 RepID=A0A6J5BJ00_9BURK|nr:hypothetical protein LMG22037_03873 [Paraburkholderia phenoliruptrix]